MKPEYSVNDNIHIFSIEGNFTNQEVDVAKEYITAFIKEKSVHAVIINCEELTIIDSKGLGLLVYLFKLLGKRQAKLLLTHVNQKNKEVFQLTRINDYLPSYSTDEEAIAAVSEVANAPL